MQDFKKLRVWHRAQTLTVAIFWATDGVAEGRAPGLRSQMRRAVTSIAANIAEGAAQTTARQFARYLQMAVASATELRSHLDLAARLGLLGPEEVLIMDVQVSELIRMLVALTKRVREHA